MKQVWMVMAFLLFSSAAAAQGPMDGFIANLIYGFQTGTVNLQGFTRPVQQQIINQTQGTLRYQTLAQQGPLQNVTFLGAQQLPAATSYWYRSEFSRKSVDWHVTVGADGLIQFFEFHEIPPVVRSDD